MCLELGALSTASPPFKKGKNKINPTHFPSGILWFIHRKHRRHQRRSLCQSADSITKILMMEGKTDFVFVARPERDACWSWSPTADLLWSGTHQNPTDRQRHHVFNTTEPQRHRNWKAEQLHKQVHVKKKEARAKIQERNHPVVKRDQKNTQTFNLCCNAFWVKEVDRSLHSAYHMVSPLIYTRVR